MHRRSFLVLPLVLTTLLCAVAPAPAQIGGLVRRAKTAITDPKASTESAAPRIKPEEQLTPEHLDAFSKGLDAEEAVRKEAARQAAKMKTPKEYQSCMIAMMQSADYQKVMTTYTDEIEKAAGKNDESLRATERYGENLKALSAAKCGPNPDEAGSQWAAKTAAAAEAGGAKAAGVTTVLYAQWKERVVPFCNLPASKRGSGVVRAEGYAYLAAESEALAPRCGALMPKIKLGT
jgi:hypothetical protein